MPVLGSTAYNTCRAITSLVRALLNDAANLLSVPVNVATIVRSNVLSTVTVSLQLPHNMVPGDNALVSGVGTASFNGTFPVATVPTPYQFTYVQAGANANDVTGQVQGFGIGAIYTDSVLIPFVNSALEYVGNELQNTASATFINDEVLLVVPAIAVPPDAGTQVAITDSTAPPNQLPVDLLMPLKIWERENLSTDDFTEMIDLTSSGGLPAEIQGQTLEVWEWRGDGIYFLGATVDTQIRLRYLKFLADVTDGTSTISIRNVRNAVADRAAYKAGRSRGSPLAADLKVDADASLEQLVSRQVRSLQGKNYRMRPFSRRRGYTPF